MGKQHGFTLIELLFTVIVLAILASVAIPSYQKYMRDARLREAHTLLIKNAHLMEQFYQQRRSFKQTSTTWPQLAENTTGHFCIRFQGNARGALDEKFTLKAVAIDKNNEPRALKINESLIAVVCESTASTCADSDSFFRGGSTTDKKCTVYQ